jgi:hypothetical protein
MAKKKKYWVGNKDGGKPVGYLKVKGLSEDGVVDEDRKSFGLGHINGRS